MTETSNPPTTLNYLMTRKKELDARIEREKAELDGEVSRQTALAWWDVVTTIRDLKELQHGQ